MSSKNCQLKKKKEVKQYFYYGVRNEHTKLIHFTPYVQLIRAYILCETYLCTLCKTHIFRMCPTIDKLE